MSMRRKIGLLDVLFCILFLFFVAYPFLDAYVMKGVSFDREIDPEFFSGLITASSILFGFSTLLVVTEKPIERMLYLFLMIPLFLIVLSGTAISGVALGKENAVEAFLLLSASFNANILSTMFLAGYRAFTWVKKTEKTSKENESNKKDKD